MTALATLLIEARERGNEPDLVDELEQLIADIGLLTPYDAAGKLHARWGIQSEQGRPWEEPGELDWMEIGGHMWATDGAIAFREDAPRPLWRRLDTDFEEMRDTGPTILGWLRGTVHDGWPSPPVFSPRFAPLLREFPAAPHGKKLFLGACRRGGEIIALLAPLRRGCRGVGFDGVPVEASPEPLLEEWTDDDARRLRRLVRKARTDEVAGGVACTSAKEHRELFALQAKQKRCAA